MPTTSADLETLYQDSKACAQIIGLSYADNASPGITRVKHGKGFRYIDTKKQTAATEKLKARITSLVIPPAWQEVWICPKGNGHILATGIDERGRKQYIYHPKWRTMRDLIKFYRLITFAQALPTIRKIIDEDLALPKLSKDNVIGTMLWLLDNTYMRVGNDLYFEENESVGLATLSDEHVVIAGSVVTLAFKGKSGKDHHITIDNKTVANTLSELKAIRGPRLFRYRDESGTLHDVTAQDINAYLADITNAHISAKDFRTWGGTLMAFNHLVETEKLPTKETPKDEKVIIQAVDAAAAVLGNTRTIAKNSYVHPDILQDYGSKHFTKLYAKAQKTRKKPGLDKRETELLVFLEDLFEHEFTLLKNN